MGGRAGRDTEPPVAQQYDRRSPMPRLRAEDVWRAALDLPFLVLCVAVAASLVRAVDQPGIEVSALGTTVRLVPADIALVALGALVVGRLLGRGALPEPARAPTAAAAALSLWLVLTSAANGGAAFVGAAKLLEYGVLALGVVLFVRRRVQLWALASLLVALTVLADLDALAEVVQGGLVRQASFLGPHDFAALATLSLTLGVVGFFAEVPRALAAVAVVAGAIGVALGAALAGLLGVYLAVGAILALAFSRRAFTRRALAWTGLVVVVVTASVLALRLGDFGVLGEDEDGGVAGGSWRQRLIYAYIGGRVFLDNPVLGTGWHGVLPPDEFARYLPDARRAFPDEPARYFPSPDDSFIPQQTYDQVLFELGLVGAVLFVVLGALTLRTAIQVGTRWPPSGPDEALAYLPAAWLGSVAGALAGAALFGGNPLTGLFWLTLGVCAVGPSLLPPRPARTAAPARREPAPVA